MKPTESRIYCIWDRSNRRHTIGSALIALIAAILIFSVLAAALLPMVSTSGEQAAIANLGDKAYLLAEAGYRYAKSRYDNVLTVAAKDTALEALDTDQDGNFTLSDGQGRFGLDIFSYFFSIPAGSYPAGNPITANPPGRLPIISALHDDNVTIPDGQLLSIDGALYTIDSPDSPTTADEADDNITFYLEQPLEISNETRAYPVARANQTSLVIGQNFAYQSGQGAMFPLRNGRISVQGYPNPLFYHYNNRTSNRFEEVRDPADTAVTNLSFPANALIVLNQSIRVRSTGIVGGGVLETRREVNYYIAGESEENEDVPVALSDFQATDDNATVTTIGGNQALAITQATNDASLLQLDSTVGAAPLRRANRRGGGYLSYDTQVKVGFYSGSSPLTDAPIGIIPSSVTPVAAGLSFRLNNGSNGITSDTDYNGYGLSFMRANNTSAPIDIFSNIVPSGLNDQPLMVLWQQTGAGITWLAYKNLQPYLYPAPPASFDDVLAAWTATNVIWRIDNIGGRNASLAWHYVDNNSNATTLQSPLISLNNPAPSSPMCDGAPIITLSFWCRELIELSRSSYRDALISYNGGAFSPFTPSLRTGENGWYLYTYDLSSRAGQTIRVQFTVAPSPPVNVQWDIDDFKVFYEHCRWPVQDSTLLVRLREAAVVRFGNGQPREISQGEWVYGETSGTRGRVLQPPLVTSGNWSASTPAAGTLLLDNLSVNPAGFQANENLLVVGGAGGIGARVVSYSDATDRKVNIIKVFYASEDGSGAANDDPLDPDILPYPRRGTTDPYRWPPEEDENWTAEEDYFRLVQWDEINDANVSGLDTLSFIDDDNRTVENAVIGSYHEDLQSPDLNDAAFTELGLHGYGDVSNQLYFDDFGLRLFFGTSALFDTVLQQ